jgi:hypothetical protein
MKILIFPRVGLFLSCISFLQIEAFLPLGSDKPDSCTPGAFQCPSHMICVERKQPRLGDFKCVCDRFFGFSGVKCTHRTKTTWFLFVTSSLCSLWSLGAVISNVALAIELRETGRLKMNRSARTLLFNTLTAVLFAVVNGGMCLTAINLDPNMVFYEQGRAICLASLYFFLILSSLSVSVVWIIDLHKATPVNSGSISLHEKKKHELATLCTLYSVASVASCLVVSLPFILRIWIPLVSATGVLFSTFIGFTYQIAGRRILRELNPIDVSSNPKQPSCLHTNSQK